ncbi:4-mannosyl-glycoprotein 4-beta-N-acetylglucosaminyltransferase, Beta-1 [Lucilia cuprina]|nr:4-mannosyl-glycoprotein 4-beta-N-acetylglucosaminyltransferase, Beta-1 [Lucilia cuprina]
MHLRLSSTQHNGRDLHDGSKEMMQLLKPATPTNINQQVQQQLLHNQHNHNHLHQHHQQQTFTKGTWTKRFILWSILLIQFGFILCFWLMQLGLSDKLNETTGSNHELEENRIHFVQSAALKASQKLKADGKVLEVTNFQWPSRDLKFQNEFLLHKNTYNLSEAEKIMFGETALWCFKEGTVNETRLKGSIEWDDSNPWQENCECWPEWHGRDCGQPEVIWRALLTAKMPYKVKDPTREEAHRLVYMLEGAFLNLDLMELQIKAVSKVVDYFIVYLKRHPINNKDLKAIKFRLKQLLPMKNYFLYHCKLPAYNNCSSAEAYRLFRQQQLPTNAIKPTDIFIFTDDKTILGHRALNFLKYYGSDLAPVIQFRLKFTIYGFYWQHPQQTYLSGLISSFQNIDNADANPTLLLTQITSQHRQQQPSLVIGDLNHFGGWFCKYCQEPDEIIAELHLIQSSSNHKLTSNSTLTASASSPSKSIQNTVVFPADKKHSSNIDAAYVQQLISTGIYLKDGKTQLQKVRRFSDKYYAPHYASEQSWKYGHLLINIYESLEDLLASDNEDEMF